VSARSGNKFTTLDARDIAETLVRSERSKRVSGLGHTMMSAPAFQLDPLF